MGVGNRLIGMFYPGTLRGITLGDWVRLLWDNGFRVSPSRWPKAVVTTAFSAVNTPLGWLERLLFARRVAAQKVLPPLFVLGHPRSGTTHLLNLLALDERFAFPTQIQVVQPNDFLLTEGPLTTLARLLMPRRTRGIDNVASHTQAPDEPELALARTTLLSPVLCQVFPQRAAHYERYLTFREVPAAEVERWKAAFLRLAQKLTYRYSKPLILKSPPDTGRIRLLLDLFPDARFVHIHRNPYAVYQSTLRLRRMLLDVWAFQRPDWGQLHAWVIRQYRILYDAFFEDRGLIPAGRYVEVCYEELERDPVGQAARVYEALGLPEFAVCRPALEKYVSSLADYKKNKHPVLPDDVRADIQREWGRSFEEWGYPL
jgi:hypothetical protein